MMSVRSWVAVILVGVVTIVGCNRKGSPQQTPFTKGAEPSSTNPTSGLGEAQRLIRAGNLPSAIAKLEEALQLEPGQNEVKSLLFDAQVALADDAGRRGDKAGAIEQYLKAAARLRSLLKDKFEPSPKQFVIFRSIYYNEACAFSLQKQQEKGLASLSESVDAGFDDLSLFESDTDLNSIRRDPEFPKIAARLVENVRKMAQTQAKKILAETQPYNFDFTLSDSDGKEVHLADAKGDVTILHLWGTWCGPGRQQIPQLVSLATTQKATKLVIFGLNFEDGEPKDVQLLVAKFMVGLKLPYKCLIGDSSVVQSIVDFQGYPTTLFLDAKSQVRASLVGFHDRFEMEAIVEAIRAEKSAMVH